MAQTNFRASDMRKLGSNKDSAPAASAAPEESKPKADPKAKDDGDGGVPEGTSAEVLEWVGEDGARASAALEKEEADEHPRKTLISKLEGLL